MRIKNYFQINGFALSLALKQRLEATRKRPIKTMFELTLRSTSIAMLSTERGTHRGHAKKSAVAQRCRTEELAEGLTHTTNTKAKYRATVLKNNTAVINKKYHLMKEILLYEGHLQE